MPWPLRAYVVLAVVSAVVLAIVITSTPVTLRLLVVALEALVSFFLLRRVRWLWLLTIAFIFLYFVLAPLEGNLTWYGATQGILSLVLLLHPATRTFFRKPQT